MTDEPSRVDPATAPAPAAPRRGRRRAVRPGTGDREPSVGLRAADDLDLGWQAPTDETNDDRLRRDVPPHW